MGELILSPSGRRYGANPEIPNRKDFLLSRVLSTGLPLPPKTNNRIYMGPMKDQGKEGACVFFSATSQIEFDERKYKNNPVILSPKFLYYMGRQMEGTLGQGDCGAQPRTGAAAINTYGCCTEAQEPYVVGDIDTPPTPVQLQEALRYKNNAYHALLSLADMKCCMASGYGFTIAFAVYASFEGDEIASTGYMPVPDLSSEDYLGGHQTFALDYDDTIKCPYWSAPGALIIQNSWSAGWGDKGLFYMPYAVAANAQLVQAAWIQHLGPPWVPK